MTVTAPAPPPQHDTLVELLGSSRRDFVPIRKTFLQQRDDNRQIVPGPLAKIVRRGVVTALNQYALLHARAAGRPDGDQLLYDVGLPAAVWARVLGLHGDESGRRTVGRNWRALAELNLVATRRVGRQLEVTLLREDGSGQPYEAPKTRSDQYLKIPYAFWLDGYAARLKLPGFATLMIARSLADWFILPHKQGPAWYGIAPSTIERGIRELRTADLLTDYSTWRATPLSQIGWTQEIRYILKPPLGPIGTVAKGAPPQLLTSTPATPSPSSQADRPNGSSPPPQSSGDATSAIDGDSRTPPG
jgi:hypothetical protein